MQIAPFEVEEWMNRYENDVKYNLGETCVSPLSLAELFDLCGVDSTEILTKLSQKQLTYGDILGNPNFKFEISQLYQNIKTEEVITTHGATMANFLVFLSLVEPEDEVISVLPTYQQLYSIPECFGAKVHKVFLKTSPDQENSLDISELESKVTPKTKLIVLTNPNNPTGAILNLDTLQKIIEIARINNSFLLVDETYRQYHSPSIVDLYEEGISVSSMSKVYSLAGLRSGWIALKNQKLLAKILSFRDYSFISGSIFDETISGLALTHKDKILARNKVILENNLEHLDQFIKSQNHLFYTKPQAGTTALIQYDLNLDSKTFSEKLIKDFSVLTVPGDCFEIPKSFRVGFGFDKDSFGEALNQVGEFLNTL